MYTEDARVWVSWSCSFDKHLSYPGPVLGFSPSWIPLTVHHPGGWSGWWLDGAQPVFLHPEFPSGYKLWVAAAVVDDFMATTVPTKSFTKTPGSIFWFVFGPQYPPVSTHFPQGNIRCAFSPSAWASKFCFFSSPTPIPNQNLFPISSVRK